MEGFTVIQARANNDLEQRGDEMFRSTVRFRIHFEDVYNKV